MTEKIIYIKDTNTSKEDNTSKFYNAFEQKLQGKNLLDKIHLIKIADMGIYNKGITLKLLPENITYVNVKENDIGRIIESTIEKGKTLVDLHLKESYKQVRIALRHCGNLNPENIDEYIANDGYSALTKALTEMSPENVIDEIRKSGLRGRGGGGYPTWLKWKFTLEVDSEQKYVICNADEGDPGAYMDRSMLEGDPHSLIEGMIIAGYAVKATQGYFYIRAEYPLAIERIQKAINQAYEYGLLGKNILDSRVNFDLEIRLGAGAFVCGEETALIASIEGKRGYPRPRPPYPSVKGLWNQPTVINNVETLINVPYIILEGGTKYSSVGTEKSTGTKVFALTGKIKNSGLVEVAMGMPIKNLINDIGGGSATDKKIKAVQTGGPSGGVIPVNYFDTPVSYEALQELGSIMGSGGLIVMDETDCMVDIAKFYLQFCVDESCGKCAPCRIGGYQMLRLLEKISEGKGELGDIDKLKSISQGMQKASLCGLGQTAPNPVVSTLQYFEEEYKEHILEKKCRAGKCSELLSYYIIPDKCTKCGLCFKNCPVNAIKGDRKTGFVIDPDLCIKCGKCAEVCKFDAVTRK
jgi:NADH:ubiquinone oxidoreductase subunit F (NADH-binding)